MATCILEAVVVAAAAAAAAAVVVVGVVVEATPRGRGEEARTLATCPHYCRTHYLTHDSRP